MRLSEITADPLTLINATLEHLGASNRIQASPEAIQEGLRLLGWAYHAVNIEDFLGALRSLPKGRSSMNIRSCGRVMQPSGFPDHPKVKPLFLAANDNDPEEVKLSRHGAIWFAQDVLKVLQNLLNLNDIANGYSHFGVKSEPPDPLDVAIVRAMFKKLGFVPKDIIS